MAATSFIQAEWAFKALQFRQECALEGYRYRSVKQRENCPKRIKIMADKPCFAVAIQAAEMVGAVIVSVIRLQAPGFSLKAWSFCVLLKRAALMLFRFVQHCPRTLC